MGKMFIVNAIAFALLTISNANAKTEDSSLNPMAPIFVQSQYNPHLNDKIFSEESSLVRVESGLMRGSLHDGIYQYLGVPYAEAQERFVRATSVRKWDGIFNALTYGPMCEQQIFGTSEPVKGVATGNNVQNLNIWTPSLNSNAKKPVMVWLHGGGFSSGTANEAQFHGENLSRIGDVVVVGVNHRLNALGHLDLSEFSDKYKDSANVGGLDLIDALTWIKNNIENFGGDPENVTVFGESGGGAKVLELMSSPLAKGLFHKGIVQSGAVETMGVVFNSKEASQALGRELLKELNIAPKDIEVLQTLPMELIWKASAIAQKKVAEKYKIHASLGTDYVMDWEPVSGTDFLPTNPVVENGFASSGKDVPLLIGSNLTEWGTILPQARHDNVTEEQKKLFTEAYPDEDPELVSVVDTTVIRLPLLKIMLHKVRQKGAPVYAYVFTRQIGDDQVYHTAEIPFVFSNSKENGKLSNSMSKLWSSFARNGVPSSDDIPEWLPFDEENRATMILDDKSVLRYNHDRKLMKSFAPDYRY